MARVNKAHTNQASDTSVLQHVSNSPPPPPPESLGPLGRPSPALQRQVEVAGNGSSASLSCPRGPQRGKRVNEKIFPAWDSGTQIDVYNPIGSCTEKDAFSPFDEACPVFSFSSKIHTGSIQHLSMYADRQYPFYWTSREWILLQHVLDFSNYCFV